MALKGSTELGKAFEYACLSALYEKYSKDYLGDQLVLIEDTSQFRTALHNFYDATSKDQINLELAAQAAVKSLERLEPKLVYPDGDSPLFLSIQPDAAGIAGDVRDVLCVRKKGKWTIGLSCKHNHSAVKHSRLSATIDFGKEWFGYACSKQYFKTITPIFEELAKIRDDTKNDEPALWSEFSDKAERFYIPILKAFINELKYLGDSYHNVPGKLVQYLVGNYDFYKIITDDNRQFTKIEAMNLYGSLGQRANEKASLARIPKMRLPTQFYHIDFKPGSNNTVIVGCDNGWTISMRIHNASSRVEPSLKFDVQLESLPESIYSEVQPWEMVHYAKAADNRTPYNTSCSEK